MKFFIVTALYVEMLTAALSQKKKKKKRKRKTVLREPCWDRQSLPRYDIVFFTPVNKLFMILNIL